MKKIFEKPNAIAQETTAPKPPAFWLDRRRIGILGEETAAAEYWQLGYILIGANYSCRFGEIDLIAQKEDQLVFVEVRTRKEGALVTPAESVDIHKQRRLIAAAQHFLMSNPDMNNCFMRFDVVEVFYQGEYHCWVHRIENAFSL